MCNELDKKVYGKEYCAEMSAEPLSNASEGPKLIEKSWLQLYDLYFKPLHYGSAINSIKSLQQSPHRQEGTTKPDCSTTPQRRRHSRYDLSMEVKTPNT